MTYQTIEFERADHIAWITLNRPDALNALSVQSLAEIDAAIDEIESDGSTRVVVFTGKGRAFCAGADLKGVAAEQEGKPQKPFLAIIQALYLRIRRLPMPVIAALNGITMGGGLELAMSCDIVLAADNAKIADAHANVGVIPGAGGCAVLPRLLGPVYAKYLVFSGETVLAPELHRLGFIAKLFAPDELMAGTRALAERLARNSPLGLAHMKRLIDQGLEQANVATALDMELVANQGYAHSHDFKEGVQAFNERRKPNFRGF